MNKQQQNTVKLGILVIVSAFILILALYFVGSKKNLFGDNFRLFCLFENINGLQKGNNVRFSGINIGTVESIEIKNDTTILVMLLIDEKVRGVIKSNCLASIGTDGLMGNKLVNLDPANIKGMPLNDNDTLHSLKTVNTEEMMRTLEFTNQNIALVSANLKNITENIDKSRGTLYTVLMDTSLATGFKSTISNIENVTVKLNQITNNVAALTNNLNNNKGLLNTLINDTAMAGDVRQSVDKLHSTTESIQKAAVSLDETLNKINKGDGTISKLLNDSATSEQVEQSIINFNTTLIKLNEDLEGLKHSFLLRRYFKKKDATTK